MKKHISYNVVSKLLIILPALVLVIMSLFFIFTKGGIETTVCPPVQNYELSDSMNGEIVVGNQVVAAIYYMQNYDVNNGITVYVDNGEAETEYDADKKNGYTKSDAISKADKERYIVPTDSYEVDIRKTDEGKIDIIRFTKVD